MGDFSSVASLYEETLLRRTPVATHARTLDLEGYGPKKRALQARNKARRTGRRSRDEANEWVVTVARFGVADGGARPRGPRLEAARRPKFFFFFFFFFIREKSTPAMPFLEFRLFYHLPTIF